jgi:hypothetical protein
MSEGVKGWAPCTFHPLLVSKGGEAGCGEAGPSMWVSAQAWVCLSGLVELA